MLAANYPTKKKLKESIGQSLRYEETSWCGSEYKPNGTLYVVGPSAHERKWYAQVVMKDGKIERVK